MSIIRGMGSILLKLSDQYEITVLVTANLARLDDEPKLTLSPWLNFIGDSIIMEKTTCSEISEKADSKKQVAPLKTLTYSKNGCFFGVRHDPYPAETKVTYELQI